MTGTLLLLKVLSQKLAETSFPPVLWLEGSETSASACRESGSSLWFLKEPYLSPLLPTLRPGWPLGQSIEDDVS